MHAMYLKEFTNFSNYILYAECSEKFNGHCLKNGTEVLQKYSYNTNILDIVWDYFGLLMIGIVMHIFAFIGIRRIIRSVGYF